MRGNVEQTWTPASLLLIASLAAGAATSSRPHVRAVDFGHVPTPPTSVPYRAAPTTMPSARRLELGGRIAPRQAAALLAVLTAPRARLALH